MPILDWTGFSSKVTKLDGRPSEFVIARGLGLQTATAVLTVVTSEVYFLENEDPYEGLLAEVGCCRRAPCMTISSLEQVLRAASWRAGCRRTQAQKCSCLRPEGLIAIH